MPVVILPELRDFLPIQDKMEDAELEASILKNGLIDQNISFYRVPSKTSKGDSDDILLDGHRRYKICQKHKIGHSWHEVAGITTVEQAKAWMVEHQLCRRNLTDVQRSYLIGLHYLQEKAASGGKGDSASTVASAKDVSRRKVQMDANFARAARAMEQVKPGYLKQVLAGDVPKRSAKAAPIMCDSCVLSGKVVKCKKCDDLKKKKASKPVATVMFTEADGTVKPLTPAPVPKSKWDILRDETTKLSAAYTRFLNDHGEESAVLCEILTNCGLLEYDADSKPKFLPFAGLSALIGLTETAIKIGKTPKRDEVLEEYKKACGAVPWVPPKTKFYRESRMK